MEAKNSNAKAVTWTCLLLLGCLVEARASDSGDIPHNTYFLIVSKAKAIDSPILQQRGIDASQKIAAVASECLPHSKVTLLSEPIMTVREVRQEAFIERVTRQTVKQHLIKLAHSVSREDTVFIYTHTHGHPVQKRSSDRPGGMIISLPVLDPAHGGIISWKDYADLLLAIPARNMIVLTMTCFSGGLIDTLNDTAFSARWCNRQKHGRNLVILTSQNSLLTSGPIGINHELLNPFTFAVTTAFEGTPDGFPSRDGHDTRDGRITIGEFVDYVLTTTRETVSSQPRRPNTAQPQVTGSFDRNSVLFHCHK